MHVQWEKLFVEQRARAPKRNTSNKNKKTKETRKIMNDMSHTALRGGYYLVDDTRLATGLDGNGLLEDGAGLLGLGGGRGGGSAFLLGNLLAEVDAVVSKVPALG